MRKYGGVFVTSFKQEKDAIVDTLFRCLITFIILYILIQLWSYIYGDGGTTKVINGYTLNQMLWYLIISECLANTVKGSKITRSITNEIKTGSISYKLNKPYNYYVYCLTEFMAKSCFGVLFILPTSILIGIVFVGSPTMFTIVQILPCLLVFLVSMFLSWCVYALVGLIAFWSQDSTPFYWIVFKLFMMFGMIFPVEFFPTWLQPMIRNSPIYSIMSGPASLCANFSWNLFFEVILSQLCWSAIIIGLGLLVFNIGKRKVTSNGG